MSSRYRNRRRRFGLRLNLIAGIYNYELSLLPDLANGLPSVLSRCLVRFLAPCDGAERIRFLPEETSGARAAATAIA
jgi:hypothetical protein